MALPKVSHSLALHGILCAAKLLVAPFSCLYTCLCLNGVLDHEGVMKSAETVSWSETVDL